jgi:6-phosphofructokinase
MFPAKKTPSVILSLAALRQTCRGSELAWEQRYAARTEPAAAMRGSLLASKTDVEEAFLAGKTAVECAVNGETDKMVGFEREYIDGKYVCKMKLLR